MLYLTGVIIAAIAGATYRWWWPRLKRVFKRYGEGVVSREPRAGLSSPEVEMEQLRVEERREMRQEIRELRERERQMLLQMIGVQEQAIKRLRSLLESGSRGAAESRLLAEEAEEDQPISPDALLAGGNGQGKKKGGWLRVFSR